MHAQNCHLCKHFFVAYACCICFKGVENSNGKKPVVQRKKKMKPHAFSRELIFHLAGRYHFSFSPLRYKICFVSFFQRNKIRLFDLFVCLFFNLSR